MDTNNGCAAEATVPESGRRGIGNPPPPRPQLEKRTIRITPALNGHIVEVGCKTIVFETTEKFLIELKRYLENPLAVEMEYLGKYKGLV